MVCGYEKQRPKSEREIRIADQVARRSWCDPKLFRVDTDVNGGAEEGGVAEERVEGADDKNEGFAPVGPLCQACQLEYSKAEIGKREQTCNGSLGSSAGTGYSAWP